MAWSSKDDCALVVIPWDVQSPSTGLRVCYQSERMQLHAVRKVNGIMDASRSALAGAAAALSFDMSSLADADRHTLIMGGVTP